jgi:uncharacterized protein
MVRALFERGGLAVLLASGGGFMAASAGVPLGWMLGALVACAVAAMTGLSLQTPPLAREGGQMIVGLGIGLKITLAVLAQSARLLPLMLVSTAYVILATTLAAFAIRRLARIDARTAFFATSSAGVIEMALVAKEKGADASAVALVQALRVTIIVLAVPPLVYIFGRDGGLSADDGARQLEAAFLLTALVFASLAALALKRWGNLPNAWLFGPMLVGTALTLGTGLALALPTYALIIAQVLLGMVLGCRFERALLTHLPRVAFAGVLVAGWLIFSAALGAGIITSVSDVPFATALLAIAPAGIAEMVLTAKFLHFDAITVTAFHLMRIVLVTSGIHLLFNLYERIVLRFDPKP